MIGDCIDRHPEWMNEWVQGWLSMIYLIAKNTKQPKDGWKFAVLGSRVVPVVVGLQHHNIIVHVRSLPIQWSYTLIIWKFIVFQSGEDEER